MRSLRPNESRAVLIGVADYPEAGTFPGVEAALHNVLRLKGLLTDPAYAGFPRLPEYTRPLLNPQTGEGIRLAIKRAADHATDVLFVYYVGHGSRAGAKRELYLTSCTSSGTESVVTTGLSYTVLRDMLRAARARVVVLVLDCCFSGIAAKVLGGDALVEDELLDQAGVAEDVDEGLIDGVCVLASSGPTQTSDASDTAGETDFTAFTGHLLAVLEQRDGGAEPLILSELFRRTEKRMGRYNVGHQPLMAAVGTAGNLVMRQAVVRPPEAMSVPLALERSAGTGSPAGASDQAAAERSPKRLLTWRTPAGHLDVFDSELADRVIGLLQRSAADESQNGARTETDTAQEGTHDGS